MARTAETVLRECREVKLLATSRELLRVAREHIDPMPALHDSSVATSSKSGRAPSIRVLARGIAMQRSWRNFRRLDGIPLAIELAAARARTLALPQLARKLDERFAILTGGNRTALPRQQTMQALIDWSYIDLLTPHEQRLFRTLAVFAGGWSLDGAAAVCGDAGDDALDTLASLVDKSLVVAIGASGSDDGGATGARVTSRTGATDRCRESRTSARETLSLEIENIRAALSWCASSGDSLNLGAQILSNASVFYTQLLYGEYLERSHYFLGHADRIGSTARLLRRTSFGSEARSGARPKTAAPAAREQSFASRRRGRRVWCTTLPVTTARGRLGASSSSTARSTAQPRTAGNRAS